MSSLDDDTPVPSGLSISNPEKALRDRAIETILTMKNQELKSQSTDEIRRTLHELYVHQIELEIQNEELRLAQVQLETSPCQVFRPLWPGADRLLHMVGRTDS